MSSRESGIDFEKIAQESAPKPEGYPHADLPDEAPKDTKPVDEGEIDLEGAMADVMKPEAASDEIELTDEDLEPADLLDEAMANQVVQQKEPSGNMPSLEEVRAAEAEQRQAEKAARDMIEAAAEGFKDEGEIIEPMQSPEKPDDINKAA